MAAPAGTEEFKDSVANVFTHEYWPVEIDAVKAKVNVIKSEFATKQKEIKELQKSGGEWKNEQAKMDADIRAKIEKTLTEDELFTLDNGISNQGFHYWGSAKFFARTGKAFAETLVNLKKQGEG